VIAAVLAAVLALSPALSWERVFSGRGAPASVYFRARYEDAQGQGHTLEVWRDGQRRLKRRTDDALVLYVTRAGGEDRYDLVDLARGVRIKVDRTSLYRIGVFSDWSALAHVLVRPAGDAILTAAADRPRQRTPAGECRWYRVEPAGQEICWSARWRLPLYIQARDFKGDRRTIFTVLEARRDLGGPGTFDVPSAGLVELDAAADMAAD